MARGGYATSRDRVGGLAWRDDPDAPCVGVGPVCVPLSAVGMAPAGDADAGVCSVPA